MGTASTEKISNAMPFHFHLNPILGFGNSTTGQRAKHDTQAQSKTLSVMRKTEKKIHL